MIGANPDCCRPAGEHAAQAGPSAPWSFSWAGLPDVPHGVAVTDAERFQVAVGVPDCAYPGRNEVAAQDVPAAPRAAWCYLIVVVEVVSRADLKLLLASVAVRDHRGSAGRELDAYARRAMSSSVRGARSERQQCAGHKAGHERWLR